MENIVTLILACILSLVFWLSLSTIIGYSRDIKAGKAWIRKNVKLF